MKTEQEQIEAIYNLIISHLFEDTVYSLAEQIYEAGYGDISEYKAEIERLKDEIIYLERKIAIRDNALKDRDKAIEMLEGKQDTIVKQAKIDVLNELREKYATSGSLNSNWATIIFVDDIDELIEEVENDK